LSRKYPIRPWVSAHAVIYNDKNEILLAKRAGEPKKEFWFPPGGAIELGETVVDGIKREILEETCITVKNMRFVDYIDAITRDKESKVAYHYTVFIFVAEHDTGMVSARDDALDAVWVTEEIIRSGKFPVPGELLIILDKINARR